ncbi:hypothetical protein DDB_G0275553 [Dictyostelium discoideum AX4]|uniref:IPT/TIG domain-containing protein n=1 Tax=Dictyostelium discoideum TaxID=44689 RepID=Q869L2_DICDI|nr:hypothetical protein DDB_G0275553 [Dictyostelium discoideum AX4]EAL69527.1 hypothetical protein DDB_G0275553 [Dictyostelium discoideum AX4]|eukprot:XP_643470.1 hypothetical protein DDB_G0275553 [Dictyostelium discoideum AX4]
MIKLLVSILMILLLNNLVESKCEDFENCPTFFVESLNIIANTYGSVITVNGVDFGSDVIGETIIVEDNIDGGGASVKVLVPDSTLEIDIPAGQSDKNFTIIAYFLDYNYNQTFNYTYEKPVISSYTFKMKRDNNNQIISGSGELSIIGKGFSYKLENNVTLNGQIYKASKAINGSITLTDSINPTNYLDKGGKFEIMMNVGGQISESVTFYLFEELSITNIPKLNITGGKSNLNGSFKTSFPNLLNLKINNIPCEIESIDANNLVFKYPSVSKSGKYPLTVSFGDESISQDVEYVIFDNDNDDDDSDDDDRPSNSNVLSYSLILISSILFILKLII